MVKIGGESTHKSRCKNIKVITGDGRVFDLGDPDSIWFGFNLLLYKLKRKIYG